jgi:Flp pilus assembly protein TadG
MRHQRGQSLVEMTVGFVVLIVLLSGLLDLGRLYFIYVALEDGAGEAALYLSINPNCPTDNGNPTDGVCDAPNNAFARAQAAGGAFVDWTAATITVTPNNPAFGNEVLVTIQYNYELVTPVIPQIAGANPLPITARASQIVISKD